MPPPLHKTGFTLIETALALLAISLALLGIFGLARHGLKSGGDAENETRCAMLADTIIETLKAKNNELAERKLSLVEWQNYWATHSTFYLPHMSDIADFTDPISIVSNTNKNDLEPLQPANPSPVIRWNPSYKLSLSFNTGTYDWSEIYVTLALHPGMLQSGADPRIYSAVLSYTGGLP